MKTRQADNASRCRAKFSLKIVRASLFCSFGKLFIFANSSSGENTPSIGGVSRNCS